MTRITGFGTAAEGQIPTNGEAGSTTVLGKDVAITPENVEAFAQQLGRAVEDGVVNTVNMYAGMDAKVVQKVQPGGRPLNEVPEDARDGARYEVKDMFGVNPS